MQICIKIGKKMKEYTKVFKALSDTTRLRILKVIIESGSKLCVCELVNILQLPFYTISRHLKELKNANFLTEERDGTFVLYSIVKRDDDFFKRLIDLIKFMPEEEFKIDLNNLSKILKGNLISKKRNSCITKNLK